MKRIQVLAFTKEVSTGTPYRHVSLDSESRDTGLYLLTVHWELATGTGLKFHLYVVTILLFEIYVILQKLDLQFLIYLVAIFNSWNLKNEPVIS